MYCNGVHFCKLLVTLINMLYVSHCTVCGAEGQGFNTASNLCCTVMLLGPL